ncbi:Wzz/FepE/Etk N-terminal domain-containing protein [Chitinophaga varians]|uniref:Wzz/FepE/Etk N-terminal domain-containing protein n=1 Tax=Chitinophaga varians TaxID=2202339 RepID=UPI00165FC050|nr:Wzz/FepE/Etk N-terminal domain-containing protein [Chitinophaga varians]MBC9910600.1 lipopolysaccharide biosynthesis protein [Chitinophaga varians]
MAYHQSTNEAANRQQEDGISLKEFILKVKDWINYLWRKKLIVVLFGLIGGGLGLTYALLKKPQYIGELTFIVEDTKSSSLGSYAGLAAQFGIDLPGNSGSGIFSGDNILEFLKSRLIVSQTLLTDTVWNGKAITLADLYIDANNWKDGWKDKKNLQGFAFPLKANERGLTRLQDSIMILLHKDILKKNLSVLKPDKKSGFIYIGTSTTSEVFSKLFTERLVNKAIDFFVTVKTQRSRKNVEKLEARADSILGLLNRKTYTVAETQDINVNPVRRMATVRTEIESRDKVMLGTMYGEVVKNLEMAKIQLSQETPIIQRVDEPIWPLKKVKVGKAAATVVGGILAGLLILVWFSIRYFLADILKEK